MAAPPITERHLPHFHRRAPMLEKVRAATTANITISTALNNGDTLDGLTLATGDRVLVKDQSTASGNGIYVVGVTPVRDYDLSTVDPAFGFLVYVIAGTANAATLWKNTNTTQPTIDTTSLTFVQIVSGTGLTDPMTTRGDVIVRDASNVTARLGIGATGKILSSDGTDVSWGNGPMTTAADLIVGGTSGIPTRLAKGSDSQVLTVDPTTHLIVWANSASGFTNPMTTKGDVIVGDTGGSAIRKAVGTDGQVLTADAASTGGIKWAAAGSGGGLPAGKLPVQDKTQNGSTNTNSLALTLGSTPTNGNLLILVSARDDNGTISSITQTNVTWAQVATSTAAPRVEVWKGTVSASASTSITVAYSSTSFSQYVVTEWNGITGTLDTSAINSGLTTLGSLPRTPPLLPGNTNALVIGGCSTTSNGNAYLAGVFGNLRTPDSESANTMRMHCVFGFPGQTYCWALGATTGSGTQSGVVVSLT